MATTDSKLRYAVAPFSSGHGLNQAFTAWQAAGLPGADLTLVGSQPRVEDLLGMRLEPLTAAPARLRPRLRQPAAYDWPARIVETPMTRLGIVGRDGRLVASDGPFADYLLARNPPDVTRFDMLAGRWLPPRLASNLSDRMDDGALLLWAALTDDGTEPQACQTMLRHCDGGLQIHDLAG